MIFRHALNTHMYFDFSAFERCSLFEDETLHA